MQKNEKTNRQPFITFQSITEWIVSNEFRNTNFISQTLAFHFDHPLPLSLPKSLDNPVYWKFHSYMKSKTSTGYGLVAMIPNGRVLAHKGVVISPDNKLLWSFHREEELTPKVYSTFVKKPLLPVQYIHGTVADLRHVWAGKNYFHWLFDVLPRIDLLRKSNIPIEKYIISPPDLPFKRDTLQMLGISPEQVIICNHHTHYLADKLVVSSHVTEPQNSGSSRLKWASDFLRKEFMPYRSTNNREGFERIFISRKGAKRRRIANEDAVLQQLASLGFKAVQLESLSVAEQIRLFSIADVIVAPHGAGLANLVFSKPSAEIFELFSPMCVRLLYWILSNLNHLDYHYLIGKGRRYSENADLDKQNAHIKVNQNELTRLLELAEIK